MEDRRLSADEIAAWVGRITSIGPQLRGPVYFLWGTDHRNVPQMNRSALAYGIPAEMRYDWKAVVQSAPGSILGMLRASKKTTSPRLGELGDEAICRRKSDNGSAAVVAKRGIKRFFAVVDDT